MPAWVEDEAAWDKAKKIVEEQKGTAEGYWPLVTHIYKNIVKHSSLAKPLDIAAELRRIAASLTVQSDATPNQFKRE